MGTTILAILAVCIQSQPIEDAVSKLNARVEIDSITGFHDISGAGHRLRVGPGLTFMLVDGQVTPLGEPAVIRGGRLVLSDEIAAAFKRLFLPKEPPAASHPTVKKIGKAAVPHLNGFKLVLDPGHGGMHTGGKSYSGKLFEKDVTLDICKKLKDELEGRGIEVILTRDSDRHFSEDVHEDLQHRVDVAARSRPDLFVSIHLNWSENKTARGFEVYVPRESKYRSESDKIAELVHAEMVRGVDSNDRGIKEAGFYVLRRSPCPCTLVELEFLSNPQGERDMMSKDHRGKVVDLLCDAIAKYARAKGF
jgi:N-acetylmuramoyl-L-alanine amidase